MASFDELMAMAQKADSAGNEEDARELVKMAQQAEADERQSTHRGGSAMDTVSDFGHGIKSGLDSASQIGQKLLWRTAGAFGMDGAGDMLDIVTAKQADRVERNAQFKERSPFAFGAGEIVGETAFTAPIGGVAGMGGKLAVNGGRALLTQRALTAANLTRGGALATTGSMAAEGAATGAYMADGKDVGKAALQGAAFDTLTGHTFDSVGRLIGNKVRNVLNTGKARKAVDAMEKEVADRVIEARDMGGIDLNSVDALANKSGFDYRDRLRAADTEADAAFAKQDFKVNSQKIARAEQMAGKYGATDNVYAYEKALEPMREALSGMREADEATYKSAYKAFDKLAAETDTRLPTDKLYSQLADFMEDNQGAAYESLAGKINRDLARYGIRPSTLPTATVRSGGGKAVQEVPKGGWFGNSAPKRADPYLTQPSANPKDLSLPKSTSKVEIENPSNSPYVARDRSQDPAKPLSLENFEDLIQSINAHWSSGLNDGEKRYIGEVKGLLEKHVDSTLAEMGEKAGVGSQVYQMGKAARDARRSFSENWTSKDIFETVTKRIPGSVEEVSRYAVDYSKVVGKLFSKDGAQELALIQKRLKAKSLTDPNAAKAWESIQQAPLLEAFAAGLSASKKKAGGNVNEFSVDAYKRTLKRLVPTQEAAETLWGKQRADEVFRMIRAWEQHGGIDMTPGNRNPSGTAAAADIRGGRFLGAGAKRGITGFISAVFPDVIKGLSAGKRRAATQEILSGVSMPEAISAEIVTDMLNEFEDKFIGAGKDKYGNLLRTAFRVGATSQFVENSPLAD